MRCPEDQHHDPMNLHLMRGGVDGFRILYGVSIRRSHFDFTEKIYSLLPKSLISKTEISGSRLMKTVTGQAGPVHEQ